MPGSVAGGLSLRRQGGSTGDTRDQHAAGDDAHLAHSRAGRTPWHRLSLARPLDDRGCVMPKIKRPRDDDYDDEDDNFDEAPQRTVRARDIPYSVAWFRDRI